jgi:hypothetical protein
MHARHQQSDASETRRQASPSGTHHGGRTDFGNPLAEEHKDPRLTPQARRELAGAALLRALDVYLANFAAERVEANEWVDQHASPLGKRAHLEAVRRGAVEGSKVGRRVLVRRADLEAFLERHPAKDRRRARASGDERTPEEVAAEVLAGVGLRLRRTK